MHNVFFLILPIIMSSFIECIIIRTHSTELEKKKLWDFEENFVRTFKFVDFLLDHIVIHSCTCIEVLQVTHSSRCWNYRDETGSCYLSSLSLSLQRLLTVQNDNPQDVLLFGFFYKHLHLFVIAVLTYELNIEDEFFDIRLQVRIVFCLQSLVHRRMQTA